MSKNIYNEVQIKELEKNPNVQSHPTGQLPADQNVK